MTRIDRRTFLAAAGLATAGGWQLARAAEGEGPTSAAKDERFRGPFLRICDALCPVLDAESKNQFYKDSYAVRGLAVAHDLAGKKEYLDVCRRWAGRMVDYQDRMDPPGAYFMNYGRRPGKKNGHWYIGDSSSIALAVQAVGVRSPDPAEKTRLKRSVAAYAKLVIDNFVRPTGGVTDGHWPEFNGEWWCSTGIFGSLCFLLHEETGDEKYLKLGEGAVGWLNRQRFENSKHIDFKEAAPSVLMYVFEAYSAGMSRLKQNPTLWKESLVEINRALEWMAANQKGRGAEGPWDYDSQWGSKLGGLPFHLYVWSRWLPDGKQLAAEADRELAYIGRRLADDPAKHYQLAAFAMMSYAERLRPGGVYRMTTA
ncbi:MAG: hypothetical protein JW959_10705 [Pirellulales bacterium]|nr:hypothetical protein [Pirellulales bacterium]